MSENIEEIQSAQTCHIEEIDNTQEESVVSKEEYDKLHNKYLMLAAEFDNFSKRTKKQMANNLVMQDRHLLETLTPAINNIYTSALGSDDYGLMLLLKSFKTALASIDIDMFIPKIGDTFDCDCMEAIRTVPAPDDTADNTVVEVYCPGYKLKDTWVSYPKVSVYQA